MVDACRQPIVYSGSRQPELSQPASSSASSLPSLKDGMRADRPYFWSGVDRISRDSQLNFTIGAAVARDA